MRRTSLSKPSEVHLILRIGVICEICGYVFDDDKSPHSKEGRETSKGESPCFAIIARWKAQARVYLLPALWQPSLCPQGFAICGRR